MAYACAPRKELPSRCFLVNKDLLKRLLLLDLHVQCSLEVPKQCPLTIAELGNFLWDTFRHIFLQITGK